MRELSAKTICLDFQNQENYEKCISNKDLLRKFLEKEIEEHPELFPEGTKGNWRFYGFTRMSKKTGLRMPRIQVGQEVYQIRPSFIMPFQIGLTEYVSQGLNMKMNGASFDRVVENYGKYPMYWYRALVTLGRNSIVGTTVKKNPKEYPGR